MISKQPDWRKKRKRFNLWERAPIFCMAAAAILVVLLVITVFRVKKSAEHRKILANQETFCEGIYVEAIPLGGLTMTEAKARVEESVSARNTWGMTADCGGEIYAVENILEHNIDEVLAEAFKPGHEGSDSQRLSQISQLKRKPQYYTVADRYEESAAQTAVKKIAAQYDVEAKDAALVRYIEGEGFQYSEEAKGRRVDTEDLLAQLKAAFESGNYGAVLTGAVSETEPQRNVEQAKEAYTCLAKFRTEASVNNADRDHNVKLAADTINNTLLAPGEEFSMNGIVGETSEAQGYRQAATYAKGQVVPEFGGGVCQVSSTIYNAAVKAGLHTTERKSHSMTVAYVPLGEDAMIAYGYSDLKFENNSDGNILVLTEADGAAVTCYLYGIPILEDGITVAMDSEIEEVLPIPDPEYVDDETLAPGEEKYKSHGKEGYQVRTDLVTYKNGEEISREFLHNSQYNAQAPVIRRGK
ncbi:MAG: VanW family protein [Lachnospiraceae bacterium]